MILDSAKGRRRISDDLLMDGGPDTTIERTGGYPGLVQVTYWSGWLGWLVAPGLVDG